MSTRGYPANTWRKSIDMKKGPNLRWSLIQCSGGDEGDRTPDLLTASQALSQLSYAPVRRSTIRELGRRCKDNFGKTFGGASADAGRAPRARGPRCPIRPAGRAPRAAAWPPPSFPAPPGHLGFRRFSLSRRGPPSAQRPSRRRRAHYRGQPRPRRPGDLKTMPVYGAGPGTPEHAVIGKIKTAGRRLAYSVKCRVWTAGPGPAPLSGMVLKWH